MKGHEGIQNFKNRGGSTPTILHGSTHVPCKDEGSFTSRRGHLDNGSAVLWLNVDKRLLLSPLVQGQ